MSKVQDFEKALAEVDAETTRIGDYIGVLVAQLQRTDMTDAEEQAVLERLTAASERLKGVGMSVENPVPEGELPPVEPPPA